MFDEVDTGVGGAVAEVIGQKLTAIASGNQVLCITHSPQVAVYAHQHFFVHKIQEGGRTHSRIRRLDEPEHLAEVSRMLGGIQVSKPPVQPLGSYAPQPWRRALIRQDDLHSSNHGGFGYHRGGSSNGAFHPPTDSAGPRRGGAGRNDWHPSCHRLG